MKYHILFMLMTICVISCNSQRIGVDSKTAKNVSENFPKIYTGLDTLIRIDGYYYQEDNSKVNGAAFMLSSNGEFNILYVQFKNHIQIQEAFRNKSDKSGRGKGNYTLSGDTMTVRWAMPFQFNSYDIFSQQYVIENNTTLRQIFDLCETCGTKRDPVRNEIYKFYEFKIDK